MQLEEYFVFLGLDDIRIKGAGVAIEHVLYDYLYRSETPEAIAARYPTVRLEHVYATITYYWHYQKPVEAYLARWLEREKAKQEQEQPKPAETLSPPRKARPAKPVHLPLPAQVPLAVSWSQ